jgi:hypothetical protein
VFAYIDGLSALSAEGYAQAQSAAAGETERRRRRLAALLVDPEAGESAIRDAAEEAGWELPERLAALAWAEGGDRLVRRLAPDALVAEPGDDGGPGLALLADPEAPGLAGRLERAALGGPVVLGPAVEPLEAPVSAERARAAVRLIQRGVVEAPGFSRADDHLGALVAYGDELALEQLAQRRLAPLDGETPASRRRLAQTLRSWLDHQGEVARVADELHVHPQTVRYRLARLRERFGDRLDDPETRLELALALRATVSAVPGREASGQPTD